MPPQPHVSPVPQHHDGSSLETGTDEARGQKRRLKPMISDSDHRLKTAQNEARTEEALLLAQDTKRRRRETAQDHRESWWDRGHRRERAN